MEKQVTTVNLPPEASMILKELLAVALEVNRVIPSDKFEVVFNAYVNLRFAQKPTESARAVSD